MVTVSPAVGVLQRVVDDVDEHLAQPVAVPLNRGHEVGLLVDKALFLMLGALLEHEHRLGEFRDQIHLVLDELHAAALDAAEIEQLLHHAGEAFGFSGDDPHPLG